jgi:hypothetical protein
MPNYCHNNIRVTGSSQSLDRIKERFEMVIEKLSKNEGLWARTYHNLFNTPQPFPDDKLYPKFDVYKEYGSKWFIPSEIVSSDEDIIISGDSAWGPVTALCEKLCKEYGVKIEIEFEESGNDFGGYVNINESGEHDESGDFTYLQWQYISDREYFFNEMVYFSESYDTYEDFMKDYSENLNFIKDDLETQNKIKEIFENADKSAVL